MDFIGILSKLSFNHIKETNTIKNEPSLIQGKEIIKINKKYTQQATKSLASLQTTGIPGVNSLVEAMDTSNPRVGVRARKLDSFSIIEDEFNRKLVKYTATYKLFIESLIKTINNDKNIQQYFGQAVTTSDGNYSYINDYGYTHKYSTDAWSNNNVSCPSTAININDVVYNSFRSGLNMRMSQPCGIAGKNIQNITTKEFAWVDIKGIKHIYSSELWKNKNETCNIETINLNNDDYNAVPSGGNMTQVNTCTHLNIDPLIWSQLTSENKELIELSKQIVLKLKSDSNINNGKEKKLLSIINKLSKQHDKLKTINKNITFIDAKYEESYYTQRLYYIQLISLIIFFIIILFLIIYLLIFSEISSLNIVICFILVVLSLFTIQNN